MVAYQINGFAPVAGLADDAQVHMLRKELAQTRTNNCVVIDNADIDHAASFYPRTGGLLWGWKDARLHSAAPWVRMHRRFIIRNLAPSPQPPGYFPCSGLN